MKTKSQLTMQEKVVVLSVLKAEAVLSALMGRSEMARNLDSAVTKIEKLPSFRGVQ